MSNVKKTFIGGAVCREFESGGTKDKTCLECCVHRIKHIK